MPKITVGKGLRNPIGEEIEFPSLIDALDALPAETEQWWSPHRWDGGKRSKDGWLGACAVVVDVDYQNAEGAHTSPSAEATREFQRCTLRCNLYHMTPRGARLIYTLARPLTDKAAWVSAAKKACEDVQLCLHGAPGWQVDAKATCDLARLFWSPRAIVDGETREGAVVSVRDEPWEPPKSSRYFEAALRGELERVRNASEGDRNNALNQAAFSLAQLGLRPEGELLDAAREVGLGDAEALRTIQSGFDAGERTPRMQAAGEDNSWTDKLIHTEKKDGTKTILPCIQNAQTILQHDPRWKGVLAWDQFNLQQVTAKEPPWHHDDRDGEDWRPYQQWTDADDIRLELWLSRHFMLRLGAPSVFRVAQTVAKAHAVHPVRTYLSGLTWDGEVRLDSWLSRYVGAEPTAYHHRVGRWWLISAVARIKQPGCQVDHVLILEGLQGAAKSTTLRTLFGDQWFSDSLPALGDKDVYQYLRGQWCVELSELDRLNKADASRAKAFFSSRVDRYRPSYGRHVIDAPRQCVFAGTVNESAYLKDATGNRRFWPVACGLADVAALRRDRDQIWAEACVAYLGAARWWPTSAEEIQEAADAQEDRYQGDEWEDKIAARLDTYPADRPVILSELAEEVLDVTSDRLDMLAQKRIGSALRRLGYERRACRLQGILRKCWFPRDTPTGNS